MKRKMNIAVVLAVSFAVAGYAHGHGANCNHGHRHEEKKEHESSGAREHGHGHGHACRPNGTKEVSVSLAIQRVMGLKTVHAEKRRIASTLSFAGRYELVPDARKVVSSPVAGRLSLLVKTLDNVKRGDALFTVTSPGLVARSREISVLEKRLKVYREIKTPNAALENELAVKSAEREAMLAGAEEKDGVVTVRAATDGMIESLIAQDGAWLETGAAAVQTVRAHHLRFKAMVAASDALGLKDGMPAKVGRHTGRIRIGVGDDTGLVPVYVVFAGDVFALAGERSRAECATDGAELAQMSVPSRCIVSIGLQPTVFVKDMHDAERFIAVPVTPGAAGNGWTAVEGLPHHCEVVIDGAYELKLALPESGAKKSSGHFHADGTFHEGEH